MQDEEALANLSDEMEKFVKRSTEHCKIASQEMRQKVTALLNIGVKSLKE